MYHSFKGFWSLEQDTKQCILRFIFACYGGKNRDFWRIPRLPSVEIKWSEYEGRLPALPGHARGGKGGGCVK